MKTLILENAITLSHYEEVDRRQSDKPEETALEMAKRFYGKNIFITSKGMKDLGYEIHDKGPIVRPASSFLGFLWVLEGKDLELFDQDRHVDK